MVSGHLFSAGVPAGSDGISDCLADPEKTISAGHLYADRSGICFCGNGIVLDDASLSTVSHTDAFGRKFCEYHLFASGKEVESVGKRVSGYFCAPVGLRGIAEFLVWIISASAGKLDLVCRYGDVVCVSMHIWMEKEKRTGSFFPGRAGI